MSGDTLESSISRLSKDMTIKILKSLPINDQKNARLVCPIWQLLLDKNGSYSFRTVISNDGIDTLLKSRIELTSVYFRNWTKPVAHNNMTSSRNRFPTIRTVHLERRNSDSNLVTILKYTCKNAKEFVIHDQAFENVDVKRISKIVPSLKWENLNDLSFSILHPFGSGSNPTNQFVIINSIFKFISIPNLNKLSVHLQHGNHEVRLLRDFIINLYGFISRHSVQLKKICWKLSGISSNAFELRIPIPILEPLRSNLKLDKFEAEIDGDDMTSLAFQSVRSSASVSSFKLHKYFPQSLSPSHVEQVCKIFDKNQETLKNVYIRIEGFKLEYLKNCKALESLSVQVSNFGDLLSNLEKVNFHNVHTFQLSSRGAFPKDLDASIVKRMTNLEKIKLCSYPPYLTEDVLKTFLLLPKLSEITVEFNFDPLGSEKQIQEYCWMNPTQLEYRSIASEPFGSYEVKVLTS